MILKNADQLRSELKAVLEVEGENVRILDEIRFKAGLLEDLLNAAVFSGDNRTRQMARWLIRRAGAALGIIPVSIHPLYEAMGRGEAGGFTVPAINIRGLTYDTAKAVFRAAMRGKVGPFIFEIATVGNRVYGAEALRIHDIHNCGSHQHRLPGAAVPPGRPFPDKRLKIFQGP